ncbi:MAG: undecaprenyldiphospho-muramoylpentapeptide beta-N-acetylglucosaminyltransferase [Acidiferrobacterales bacterium]
MASKKISIMVLAGGTGGHIFPALAVADCLRAQGVDITWMGATGGMETEIVKKAEFEIDSVPIKKLRGVGLLSWLLLPVNLFIAVARAWVILGKRRPNTVLAMGGFAAGPGGLAAWLRRIPIVVHEQNAIPGLTNRVLSIFARKVLCGFPNVFTSLPKAQHVGNPVRQEINDIPVPKERFSDRSGPLRLLIIGGSSGAHVLNKVLPEATANIEEQKRPEIWHQTGQQDAIETVLHYRKYDIEAKVDAFIDDMAGAFAWADLAICRAGAMTIAELAAAGMASILVPYPFAVDDHQTVNAGFLVDNGAALLIPETEFRVRRLAETITELGNNRDVVLGMADKARSCASPGAAEVVAEICMEAAHAKSN